MKYINFRIILLALFLGVALGLVDAAFDYHFHYEGSDTFIHHLFNAFPIEEILWRELFVVIALLLGIAFSILYNKKKKSETVLKNIFNNALPICITSNDYQILMANKSYFDFFGGSAGAKCYQERPGKKCKGDECPVNVIRGGKENIYTCEITKKGPNENPRTFVVTATPFIDENGVQVGVIESFQNITQRKQLEEENALLMDKMKKALNEVKTLSSFLPICASCKKIRDDKGYWNQIEDYLREYSGAEFSHSICPECTQKLYPNFIGKISNNAS